MPQISRTPSSTIWRATAISIGARSRPCLRPCKVAARPIKPHALGTLGEAHLAAHMVRDRYAHPDSVRYKKIEGDDDRVPFVVEVAFGVYARDYQASDSDIAIGLNWSP